MEKMKKSSLCILQILPEMNVGGVETGTLDFARYLKANGYSPIVVSHGGALVAELDRAGIKHYSLPVHRKSLWTALKCVKRLRRIISEEKVDIVHARSRVPAWIAYFACRHTTAEFITTCHGYYSKNIFGRVMGWSKRVIVPSEVIGRHMVDSFGVPSENIRIIPRSVDLDRFPIVSRATEQKSAPVIAIVGRLTPLKGHEYFLRAMAKVVRSMPYVKIWVIGDAPAKKEGYRRRLEVLARRLGLSDVVEFMGQRSDIPSLLSQVTVLVMSSVVPESFGRVILEAQACGVPVVATQVGGVVEIINDEKTGLLVLPKDTDAMAQSVLRLIRDPLLANQLTEAAQEKIRNEYTLDHMASRTVAVYEELLSAQNILVIKLSATGDVVLITAALKALRKRFPGAKIVGCVGKDSRKILQRCPYLDEVIVHDPHLTKFEWLSLWKTGRRAAKYQFDKVVDFQNNKKSHWLCFLSFARESYGFKRGHWHFLLTKAIPLPSNPMGPVEHQFQILKHLGISYRGQELLELWPTESERRTVRQVLSGEWLADNTVLIGLNVSASARWPTKNWPVSKIAKLADRLAVDNIRLVLTGSTADAARAKEILRLAKSKPINLVGKTSLMELAVVVQKCRVFISPDSAPLHIAAAMRTPFIAMFGPTDPVRHMPPAKHCVVLRKDLPCAPCYSGHCRIRTHACMEDISVEEVMDQVERLSAVKA